MLGTGGSEISAERIELLVIVIAVVAIVARRLRLPYTVGLLCAGIGLGLLPGGEQLKLTRELVFSFLLPPLVFEAAINIRWSEFRAVLLLVVVFATVGLVTAAAIVAAGMRWAIEWPLTSCVVFAVLIAATDPVSVIAVLKESGLKNRIALIVESESLLNDGTAAVAFSIAVAVALGGNKGVPQAIGEFIVCSLGGVLAGMLVAWAGLILVGKASDHLAEIAVTVAMAYGSFLLAEHFHLSGVLAAVSAGLLAGHRGFSGSFTEKGRDSIEPFWEFAAFAANSIAFLLIGVRATRVPVTGVLVPTLVAIALVVVGRAVSVYGLCALFHRTSWKLDWPSQNLLFWGGLRGALALALVLGLPEGVADQPEIVAVTFWVVVFSVIVQGLTIRPLIARVAGAA